MRRIAVLFSGSGSTLQNLIDATRDGRLPDHEVVRAVSSRRGVGGIGRCRAVGVPCRVVAKADHATADAHSAAVLEAVGEADLICLAGWMNRLVLPDRWLGGKVLNVHPSLLPAFGGRGMYGRHVHAAVLARGCKLTGCTVHAVDNEIDGGPILAQRAVPVLEGDTPDTLADRVQQAERELYPQAIRELP